MKPPSPEPPTDEESPLLPKSRDDHQSEHSSKPSPTGLFLIEIWVLCKTSLPIIFAYALQMSLQVISIVIAGRKSPEDLSIAAFSYMWAMATGWLVALGGTTAIDTLASAAYTGNKGNPKEIGVILLRSFVVLAAFFVPVAIFLWVLFSEKLFLLFKQEPWLAKGSREFLTVLAPGGLGYVYFECMKKFLQAQEIMQGGTYVLFITSPLNAVMNYILIYGGLSSDPTSSLHVTKLEFGLLGASLATAISYWLSFLLLLGYAKYIHSASWRSHWCGLSAASMKAALQPKQMWIFARLAGLGFLHVGTEWWAFEIVALVAGRLGALPLAAQSVIMTADEIMNTIPFGVGVATSSRVGNLLGGRTARKARISAHAAAVLSMLLGAVVLIILFASRNTFGALFNPDPDVGALVAKVIPFVALFQIADGLNGSCGGSLRGQGKQHVGALVNIVCYYFMALPIGIWLAMWKDWGLEGLWVGQCVALYLVGFGEWAIVAWSNWDHEVEMAFQRMDDDGTKHRNNRNTEEEPLLNGR